MDKISLKLNKRQEKILDIIEKEAKISISEILAKYHNSYGEELVKITTIRDLNNLCELKLIVKRGKGRAIKYKLSDYYNIIRRINVPVYFEIEPDKRTSMNNFNFVIFKLLEKINIFPIEELEELRKLNKLYQDNFKKLSKNIVQKEFERLTIELSWKSSKIEGNTYNLLETENLIKENKEAPGHSKEEAVMILNHEKTLEYIRQNKKMFTNISVSKVEDIHYLLTKDMGISRNLRKTAIGIVGTNYQPLDNEWQIKEALEQTCQLVNSKKDAFSKAILLITLIAYIQPFEDGNKRTSRLMGNAVLLAHDVCPLSYRSIDETEYKKAMILFYEQNNINYIKSLFTAQFKFAVKNYFRVKS